MSTAVVPEITDRAALVEVARRRRMDVAAAEGEVHDARVVDELRSLGKQVAGPDLAKAEQDLARVREALAEVEADIAAIDKAAADEVARVERERAQERARAIKAAEAALLDARMAHDKAAGQRISVAMGATPDRAEYLRACAASDEAHEAYLSALAARELLEDDQ